MSQIIVGSNEPPTTIPLTTRYGTPLDNLQAWELTKLDWTMAADLRKRYPDQTVTRFLGDACPVYNCHGLTFASRRTQIEPETSPFGKILHEDGFVRISNVKEVQTGDVILYYDGTDGSIIHSGIVVDVEGGTIGGIGVPFVWSKWGKGQEVRHHWATCPYHLGPVEYYRMTKWKKPSTQTLKAYVTHS